MKIAQIAPLIERVPPKKYGGTERMINALTEELVKRGHEVTIFTTGDSITAAKHVSVVPVSLRELDAHDLYGANEWKMLNIGVAFQRQKEFDIIHDHNSHLSLPTANLSQTPVVMTLHGPLTAENRKLFEALNNPYFVTVSKAQSVPAPNLHYIGTVHHGLDMQHYPFSHEHDGYLLFVGRISPEKGLHDAITVAEYLNLELIIAAKLDQKDKAYFEEKIKPRLTQRIRWIGEVDQEERNKLMSRAMVFLHPASWREPFGLTLIEAMACGCPVIGFRRGSVPELIMHGKTGYVVEDTEEMIEMISHIDKIKREDCRLYALERFNPQRMTDEYEKIYEQILKREKKEEVAIEGNGHLKQEQGIRVMGRE